jgi:glc operon protein GlcG
MLVLSAGLTRAEEGSSQIRDVAGLFSVEALQKARVRLDRIEKEFHIPVVIETIDSTQGESIDDVSIRRAQRSGIHGIFILIAKQEHKIRVRDYKSLLSNEARVEIQEAFSHPFAQKNFDVGLSAGIDAVEAALTHRGAKPPKPEERPALPIRNTTTAVAEFEDAALSPLIVRNQIHLTLAGARRVIAESEAKATAMKVKMNIAVVDDGGHLLAFARMDGARPASAYTAMTKATSAATIRQPTGPLPPGTNPPDVLLNISLQNAAAASGGKVTTLLGGVPIVVDGQVIGAVGVGGGTGEQDAEVARAGVNSLIEELKKEGVAPNQEK